MKDLSDRMRAKFSRPEAIEWIIATYRELGSIEAVARAGNVHTRTMHRYIDAHPKIAEAMRKGAQTCARV